MVRQRGGKIGPTRFKLWRKDSTEMLPARDEGDTSFRKLWYHVCVSLQHKKSLSEFLILSVPYRHWDYRPSYGKGEKEVQEEEDEAGRGVPILSTGNIKNIYHECQSESTVVFINFLSHWNRKHSLVGISLIGVDLWRRRYQQRQRVAANCRHQWVS